MRYNNDPDLENTLMLVCLLKVYHDAGIWDTSYYGDIDLNDMDYFYELVVDAIDNAAPIVHSDEKLYKKYGEDRDEVNIYAYSSKEMQEYFKLARKLHRLEGNSQKENPYIKSICNKIYYLRGFDSYSFDYTFASKRKTPQIEIMWWLDFMGEIPMCLWIVRTMRLIKKELPKLQDKYRRVRREKRIQRNRMRKGGCLCAA